MKGIDVIAHMRQGWELGTGTSGPWMQQKGLCCGGPSIRIGRNILKALVNKGFIRLIPRRRGDPFWLHRYELTATAPTLPVCHGCAHYRKAQHYCCAEHQALGAGAYPLSCPTRVDASAPPQA